MSYIFTLPKYWVIIHYKNGNKLNVANKNTLTKEEAAIYKHDWEKKGEVARVTLEASGGLVIKTFDFTGR